MYVFDFLKRLFKKNNVGTIIYLCMNLIMYIALMGGFALPEMIPIALFTYLICLCIALSPVGEFILRIQCGCKKIKKAKYKDRLEPLFFEAYRRAKSLDPTISDHVKFFMSKSMEPNAFAVGRKTVCVTRGLLELSDEEILGILAHEFGHIAHKDTDILLVINVSNFLLTAIFFIVRVIVSFVIILAGGEERPIGSLLTSFFIDLLLVWLMSLWTKLGNLFHMKSSRMNEYRADAFSCECGFAQNLYQALYHLEQTYGGGSEKGVFAALGASHPETADRLDAIEEWKPGSLQPDEPTTPGQLEEKMIEFKNKAIQKGGEAMSAAKSKAENIKMPQVQQKIPKMRPIDGQQQPLAPPPIPQNMRRPQEEQQQPLAPPPIPQNMRRPQEVQQQLLAPPPIPQNMRRPQEVQQQPLAPPPIPQNMRRPQEEQQQPLAPPIPKKLQHSQVTIEKKQDEIKEHLQSDPRVKAVGGILEEDDYCYGRYAGEGIFYYGQIKKIEDETVEFRFFDGLSDRIKFNKLYTVDAAIEGLRSFANWNSQGAYYPCTIIRKERGRVTVRYEEGQRAEETIPYMQLRFLNW